MRSKNSLWSLQRVEGWREDYLSRFKTDDPEMHPGNTQLRVGNGKQRSRRTLQFHPSPQRMSQRATLSDKVQHMR